MTDRNSRQHTRRRRSSAKNSSNYTKPLWKKILLIFFLVILAGLLGGAGLFTYYASQAPELNAEALVTPVPSEILDKDGNVVATIGTKQRDLVTYDNISSMVKNAVLATEDSRFYDHIGIDPIRIGGAVVANLREGFGAEGGSTITQQVIKRTFLSSEKKLKRKAQEAWLALKLENQYSKEEIFEMYVNKIYYSDNIYGIQTASRYYFDKDLQELTLPQAALLAGIPQSPNNYNPYDHPEQAKERRNIVLQLMKHHGKITQQHMEEAQQVPITKGLIERSEGERSTLADRKGDEAFVDAVISEVGQYGEYNLFKDGLKIHTTMDADAQAFMEKTLNSEDIIQYPDDKNGEAFQAGVTLLDTKTGAVRAIGGGRNYGAKTERGFNFAIDTSRQPGSAIKPLLDYAPAIEKMKWSTAHILIDEPIEYQNGDQPHNWDDEFKGPVSMREALWDSRNIPAIKTFNQTGHAYAAKFIKKLGMEVNQPLDESAAIGGGKLHTNPFELAGAYTALGNNGTFTEPYTVTKIELRDGTKIDTVPESSKVMETHTAYMVTDMLKSVINHPEGTGTEAAIPGLPLAGKTGTTNYSEEERQEYNLNTDHAPDSWFAGYTPEYTAAVWTGYEHKENPLKPEERGISSQIFKALMNHVSSKSETPDFDRPADVVAVEIEKGTNPPKRASAFTPEEQVKEELFIEGTEPNETSDKYVPDLRTPTGLAADYNHSQQAVQLSWSHSQEQADTRQVSFEVSKAENGGEAETISTTEQQQLTIENIQPGTSYTFTVTAVAEDERSDPGVLRIEPQEPQPENSDSNKENDEQTNEENTGNQDNGSSDKQEEVKETPEGQNQEEENETNLEDESGEQTDEPSNGESGSGQPDEPSNGESGSEQPDEPSNGESGSEQPDEPSNGESGSEQPDEPSNGESGSEQPDEPSNGESGSEQPDEPSNGESGSEQPDEPSNGNGNDEEESSTSPTNESNDNSEGNSSNDPSTNDSSDEDTTSEPVEPETSN